MSAPTTQVLMSAGNPTGWKLEVLLARIAEDLRIKNDALEGDGSPTSKAVQLNNAGIIDCLALAGARQTDTLRRLNLLAPDPGPAGTPRIGTGIAGDMVPAIAEHATGVDPALAAATPAIPTAATVVPPSTPV